jgi:hypothetical protein
LEAESAAALASQTTEGIAALERARAEHSRKYGEELAAQREQMARETQQQIKEDLR